MRTGFLVVGPLLSAIAVLAGAFGAHGLKTRLEPSALELWETAARYLIYCGLAVTLVGLAEAAFQGRSYQLAGWLLIVGGCLFSATVGTLALGGPRWLGAVTPIGGLLLVIGFVVFAWTSIRG